LTNFDTEAECLYLDATIASTIAIDTFQSAERHPTHFEHLSTATGFHLSTEAFLGIGDRIPKSTQELLTEALGESLLDDIGPGDITSSVDDIKYGPDLTLEELGRLKSVVWKHRAIWERTDGVVDEPPEDWMKIWLKEGADLRSKGVYRLGEKDKAVVDELFDKL
jgi:hypothetical protein